MKELLTKHISDHINVANWLLDNSTEIILEVSEILSETIKNGGTVYLCGNGGSAADAQHIAAEFTGRFVKERRGLSAVALTTDTSALTAIGNDYGFDRIFERQVEALMKNGDVLIGITTSGNSSNICKAIEKANDLGAVTISLTGNSGGKARELSTKNINIESQNTARIQEMHILIGHLICSIIDEKND